MSKSKNKSGVCVNNTTKKNSGTKERNSSETKTPRSIYAKQYFADNKKRIHLLDKINNNDKYVVVQVNYNDVNQFTQYRNLANKPTSDCFFQTLFSLGRRDVKLAKQESSIANTTLKGPTIHDMRMFIKSAFNLTKHEKVGHRSIYISNYINGVNIDRDKINSKIVNILTPKIKNGYAAPIQISRYYKKTGKTSGHSMVAYKYNDELYFFDPQKHFSYVTIGNIVSSTNLYEVTGSDIIQIGYYTVSNLEHPKPLMDTTCKINL